MVCSQIGGKIAGISVIFSTDLGGGETGLSSRYGITKLRGITQPKKSGFADLGLDLKVLQIQQIHAEIPTPIFVFYGFCVCKSEL
jgi:hypothetical protein